VARLATERPQYASAAQGLVSSATARLAALVGLSVTVTFVGLVFWAWLLLDIDPQARWG
jgi:hypothetical protein